MNSTALSRRLFLTGVSSAALWPGLTAAQATKPPLTDFADICRALSGFDTVPRSLMDGAAQFLDDQARSDLLDGTAPTAQEKALLTALYTGMHSPEDGAPQRFAYSEALMYAAVEDSLNVPSYCGGLPGYWSEKPQQA